MSTTIDEKIVSISFDNKNFEKNVSDTMGSIDKLNSKLNFKGAAKGMSGITQTAEEVSKAMEQSEYAAYKSGFSFRDVWLKTASVFEYQVAGRIISSAKNMISALTIEPVKTGLQEYETQLNAIQTILANTESKGSTLEDVNAALDELNLYADKTIYNFTEMTRNIGTFTAAGVDLDTSVSAIKGIANLAAVSGSTSQQASTAMYQLSQALASGTVKLMDWNSVVNAGMGGQVFQDALKETARVHGVAIDDIIESQGSFRESLSEGWLTSEILTETLSKFTGDLTKEQILSMGYTEKQAEEILKLGNTANDAATKVKTFSQLMDTTKEAIQSGWAQTFELLIGDFEEAKKLWTGVSNVLGDIINESSESRNALLSGALDSGWSKLLGQGIMDEEGYTYHIKEVAKQYGVSIDQMIKDEGSLEAALRKGFNEGTISSDMLTKALGNLSSAYGDCSDKELENLGYTREQVDKLIELNKQFQNGSISMQDFVDQMSKLSGRELLLDSFANIYKSLKSIIVPIKEAFREIFPKTTADQLYKIIEAFNEFTKKLILSDEQSEKLKRTFKGLFAAIDIVLTIVKTAIKIVAKIIGSMLDLIGHIFGLGGGILSLTGGLGDLIVRFRDFIKQSDVLNKVSSAITKTFQKVIDKIKEFISLMKVKIQLSGFNGFLSVLGKIWTAIKAVFGKIIAIVKPVIEGIGDAFSAVWDRLAGSGGSLGDVILDILKIFAAGGFISLINKVKSIFSGVKDIFDGFDGIFESIEEVIGSFAKLMSAKAFELVAQGIRSLAVSMLILVGALLIITLIDKEELTRALAAILITMGMLVASVLIIQKGVGKDGGDAYAATKQMRQIAFAMLILSFALKKLGKMSWDEIKRGLGAMGGALAVMIGAIALLGLVIKEDKSKAISKDFSKISKMFTKVATSMLILSFAMKVIASMSWEQLGKALTGMTGAMVLLVGALVVISKISGKYKSISKTVNQLLKMSVMLAILGAVLKSLGRMSWEQIGKGFVAIGGILTLMVGTIALLRVISKNMSKNLVTKTIPLMSTLTTMLVVWGLTLKVLGKMSWKQMGKGFVAISGVLTLMVGALALLKVVSKYMGVGILTKTIPLMSTLTTMLVVWGLTLKVLGKMSWSSIARGLTAIAGVMTILLVALAVIKKISKSMSMSMITTTMPSMIMLTASLYIMSLSLKKLSGLSWSEIGRGLVAMAGVMTILVGALAIVSKISGSGFNLLTSAGAIVILSVALRMLIVPLAVLGNMKLKTIGVGLLGLAGALGIVIAAGFLAQKAAVGLLVLAAAIASIALASFGIGILAAGISLLIVSIGQLIKMLVESGDTMINSIMNLFKGMISLIPELIRAFGEALIAFCDVIIEGAPKIGKAFVAVLLAVLDILVTMIPALAKSLFELISGVLEALVQYVPGIVGAVFELIIEVIAAIAAQLPKLIKVIVDLFMSLIEGVISALEQIDKETLIKGLAGIGIIMLMMITLASAVILTPAALLGVIGISLVFAELSVMLALIGKLSEKMPNLAKNVEKSADLLGAVGKAIGSFIGGLVGGIAEGVISVLPNIAKSLSGFMENIQPFLDGLSNVDSSILTNTAKLMGAILLITGASFLNAIMSFLTGGLNMLKFYADIVLFGKAIAKFTELTSDIDHGSLDKATEAGMKLAKMAQSIPTTGGLWNLIAGQKSLASFGAQLTLFGLGLRGFIEALSGAEFTNVDSAVDAGTSLAKMASEIPTTGGLWGLIRGDNNLGEFGAQLALFGLGLKGFIKSLDGADFSNVESAVDAGVMLAEMASEVPVTGGLWSLIKGNNDLGSFGIQIAQYGRGLKKFMKAAGGADFSNIEVIVNAGTSLAQMASEIPVTGGLWGLIKGDNNLGDFGAQLTLFGLGLRGFIEALSGADFSNVKSAVDAGAMLSKMASEIPVTGGLWGLIRGDNNLGGFGTQLTLFGLGLRGFIEALSGADFSNVKTVVDASTSLAEMASKVPVTGGLWSLIKGDNNLAGFGTQLSLFGLGLRGFIESLRGADLTNAESAANTGLILAQMASKVPTTGGLWGLIKGNNNIVDLSSQLEEFGNGIKGFVGATKDIDTTNAEAAANVGLKLAQMASKIPTTGGLWNAVSGGVNLADFGTQLVTFGQGLVDFVNKVKDIVITENVESIVKTALSLGNMASKIPVTGGLWGHIKGDGDLKTFSKQLPLFGEGLKGFVKELGDTDLTNVETAATAGIRLAEMASKVPVKDGLFDENKAKMKSFKSQMSNFGEGIKSFSKSIGDVDCKKSEAAANVGKKLASAAKSLPEELNVSGFGKQLKTFGEGIKNFASQVDKVNTDALSEKTKGIKSVLTNLKKVIKNGLSDVNKQFKDSSKSTGKAVKSSLKSVVSDIKGYKSKFKDAGKALAESFEDGFTSKSKSIKTSFKSLVNSLISTISSRNLYDSLYNSGANAAIGFANGVSSRIGFASVAGSSLGSAALKAAKAILKEASPSKAFFEIGKFGGEGFVLGLDEEQKAAYKSSYGLGSKALDGVKKALASAGESINDDLNLQPTIRPVLDLSDVRSGAGTLNNMFGINPSVGVLSRVNSINSLMNSNNQNRGNDDVISAIKGLQSSIENNPRETINIDGITYSEGSELAEAIRTITRIAKIEGRV